jgi:hypothetical protein
MALMERIKQKPSIQISYPCHQGYPWLEIFSAVKNLVAAEESE